MQIFSEHLTGLDPNAVHAGTAEHIRAVLKGAIAALEERNGPAIAPRPG